MSPQMESGQQYERTSTGYQGYQGYDGTDKRPPYGAPNEQGPSFSTAGVDDNLVEVIAERLLSRLNQQSSSGKIFGTKASGNRPSPGQRLALAIVSVAILVPITIPLFAVGGGSIGSLIALLIISAAIAWINVIFNISR